MASLRFKLVEHEFKEAKLASFRIFQLVFGCVCVCVCVWLLACLGFGFFLAMTLELFVCILICLHGCLDVFKM